MEYGQRSADRPINWRAGAERLAVACVEHAAEDGFVLVLRPDTPVVPDDLCRPPQHGRVTWGEIDTLFRHWTEVGCRWVNLRFTIEPSGAALVRYEVRPEGTPLRAGRVTYANGGFDCARLLSGEAFTRLHPSGPPALA